MWSDAMVVLTLLSIGHLVVPCSPFGAILFFYELTTKRSGADTSAAEGSDYGSGILGSRCDGGLYSARSVLLFSMKMQYNDTPKNLGARVNSFRAYLTRYFGFIFFYRKRMQFMILCGQSNCFSTTRNPLKIMLIHCVRHPLSC